MEGYRQIHYRQRAGWGESSSARPIEEVTGRCTETETLDMNVCISRLIRLLAPSGSIPVHSALTDGELLIMPDGMQIASLFFALVECSSRFVPNGQITIVTGFLPIDGCTISQMAGIGCALLSVRTTAGQGRMLPDSTDLVKMSVHRVLSRVRDDVQAYGGCFRALRSTTELIFNVYLPIAGPNGQNRTGGGTAAGEESL